MKFMKKKKPDMQDDSGMGEKSLPVALSVQRSARPKKMAEKRIMTEAPGDEMKPMSMMDSLRAKRKEKMMADGGMVDLDENDDETLDNSYEDQNKEAGMKELYDEGMSDQPMDSNEMGDDSLDVDDHDMISAIRKRLKSRL